MTPPSFTEDGLDAVMLNFDPAAIQDLLRRQSRRIAELEANQKYDYGQGTALNRALDRVAELQRALEELAKWNQHVHGAPPATMLERAPPSPPRSHRREAMADAEILKHRTRFLPYGCAVTDHEALAFAHSLIAATREQVIEECATTWYERVPETERFIANPHNFMLTQVDDGPWVLRRAVSTAIRALTRPPGD